MISTMKLTIDALFVLDCGQILDGCSGSDPGRKWTEGVRNGHLFCVEHNKWERLVDVVNLAAGSRP